MIGLPLREPLGPLGVRGGVKERQVRDPLRGLSPQLERDDATHGKTDGGERRRCGREHPGGHGLDAVIRGEVGVMDLGQILQGARLRRIHPPIQHHAGQEEDGRCAHAGGSCLQDCR